MGLLCKLLFAIPTNWRWVNAVSSFINHCPPQTVHLGSITQRATPHARVIHARYRSTAAVLSTVLKYQSNQCYFFCDSIFCIIQQVIHYEQLNFRLASQRMEDATLL